MSITNETKLNQVQAAIERTSKGIYNTSVTHPKIPVLIKHLENLFALEITLLSADVPEPDSGAEQPWYPDDSGEWVEVPDDSITPPNALKTHTRVEVLQYQERGSREYTLSTDVSSAWRWELPCNEIGRIVAYKIIS